MTISRRNFVGGALGFAVAGGSRSSATAADAQERVPPHADAPERVPPWKKGEFQIHFIHTGVGESQFLIFPDGTTMLLDCPGNDAAGLSRQPGGISGACRCADPAEREAPCGRVGGQVRAAREPEQGGRRLPGALALPPGPRRGRNTTAAGSRSRRSS